MRFNHVHEVRARLSGFRNTCDIHGCIIDFQKEKLFFSKSLRMASSSVQNHVNVDDIKGFNIFRRVGRAVCIHVDLDAIAHNTDIMRSHCSNPQVGIMAVLKSDCYGHGAVQVGRHLIETGAAERLAVATVAEGVLLRKAGVKGPIHIFGNVQAIEMDRCVRYNLVPSIAGVEAVEGMAKALQAANLHSHINCINGANGVDGKSKFKMTESPVGAVHIKLDTGMRRNGCQPLDVPAIVQACDENNVPLEGIFSHLANFEDKEFSAEQLRVFDECIEPYKERGLLFHIAAAGPALNKQGCHYDLIRPGITLLGQPADSHVEKFAALGFKPTLEVKGYPTLLKLCEPGDPIGYGCAYHCVEREWIATFPIGYADGYWRSLSLKGATIRRDKTGEKCPVVGKVSMDAILVKLPCKPDPEEVFTIITADFDPTSSIMGICKLVDTIPQEALARLAPRIPRVFTSEKRGTVEILEAYGLRDELDYCRNANQVFACPKCKDQPVEPSPC